MSQHKPYPTILQGFGVFLLYFGYTILFALFFGGKLSEDLKLLNSLLVYVATFLTVHFLRKESSGLTNYSFHAIPLSVIFAGILSWVLLYILLSIFVYLYPEIETTGYMAENHRSDNIYRLLKLVLVAPLFEELIFRGVVLDGFLKRYKPAVAIFFSALIFGIMHIDPVQGTYAFFIGLLLGLIFWKTRSLLLCIILHVLNNFMAGYDFEVFKETEAEQQTLREFLTPLQFYSMYVVAVLLFIGCVYYINKYYKRAIKVY